MTLTALDDPAAAYRLPPLSMDLPELDPFFDTARWMHGLTALDFFAGVGGSSTGLVWAGYEVLLAINHWQTAIQSHAANHRGTDHWQANLSLKDLHSLLPTADILWASPECKKHTKAQGKKRDTAQLDIFDDEKPADEAAQRSRATMNDVLEALEAALLRGKPFLGGIVENVVEVVDWMHFGRWCQELLGLGYDYEIVSLNSAFAADPELGITPAPQLRNRIYIVFWLRSLGRRPDLDFRASAWCPHCEALVQAVQSWKKPFVVEPVGVYGRSGQYWYRCPTCRSVAEPLAQPIADIIDWSDPGPLVGERKQLGLKPLEPSTLARIAAGLAVHGRDPVLVPAGGTWNTTATSVLRPCRARTTSETEGVMAPPGGAAPFMLRLRGGGERNRAHSPWSPVGTISAGGEHHAVVNSGQKHMIMPYYGNGKCSPTLIPLPTVPTRDRFAVVSSTPTRVEECTFRMMHPDSEIKRAMALPPGYIVFGSRGDKTAQMGNGVTPNSAAMVSYRLAQCILGIRFR